MRESTVEEYLVEQCKLAGGEVRKVKWIGRHSAPDRVAMGLPLAPTVWVELKRPGLDATPAQRREHDRMRAAGQIVVVINSKEGVDRFLNSWREE